MKSALILLLMAQSAMAAVAAFPGAQGGGATSIGGRGGTVMEVTNLNDSGAGSLRAAVESSGARMVIFRVSGIIYLNSNLIIYDPYITIAGQTAPGSGITLAFAAGVSGDSGVLQIRTHDVIVRYIRGRPGQGGITTRARNGINIADAAHEVIVDHASVTWAGYDAYGNWNNNGGPTQKNLTFQWCLGGEGLVQHSKGYNAGSDIDANRAVMTDIDIHHCYTISTANRNPMAREASGRVTSNIWYNAVWGFSTPSCGIIQDYISNKYKHGPEDDSSYDFHEIAWEQKTIQADCMSGNPSLYVTGNLGPHNPSNLSDDNWASMLRVSDYTDYHAELGLMDRTFQRLSPMTTQTYPITVDTADTLETKLLAAAPNGVGAGARIDCAGNWAAARDSVDARLINDYFTLSGGSVTSEADVGGYPAQTAGTACTETLHDGIPDAWKTAKGYSLSDVTLNSTINGATGYTYLEDYINGPTTVVPPPPGTYEAEAAALSNGAQTFTCPSCSGGLSVENIGTVQFTVTAASTTSYTLTVYYLNGSASNRPGTLAVNGGSPVTINFPVTGSWDTINTTAVNVALTSGSNTLTFNGTAPFMADLDKIHLDVAPPPPGTYEAENATMSNGAMVFACATCSGGSSVGDIGTLQFTVTAASTTAYTLTISYLNGSASNRPGNLSVNGGAPVMINFPVTGSWNNVQTTAVDVNLTTGSNTLTFTGIAPFMADLDKIHLDAGVPALSISVPSAKISHTQATLEITGFSGDCTIELSESNTYAPLHPDVDSTQFAGSSTDTGRADTYTRSSGTVRVVTLGHMNDERSLAFNTIYYLRVSVCGTATASFTTGVMESGTTRPEPPPFNAAKWGNLGLPTFDWRTIKTYVEPSTGNKMTPLTLNALTWRHGGTSAGTGLLSFSYFAGGTGWGSPANVLNGLTSTATTTNTNPIDLYPDFSSILNPYYQNRTLEDIGVVAYGTATGTGADANATVQLMVHGVACGSVTVPLGSGAIAHRLSGSSDPDQAFPPAFPSKPFFSWSSSSAPCIRNEDMMTQGTVTISGSTLTTSTVDSNSHFSTALVAGDKIYLNPSSCTNNLCTIASVTSANIATVSETPGNGTATFKAFGFSIRVTKATAVGTATIGMQYKIAGSLDSLSVLPGGDRCSALSVTSGDGKSGYLCQFTNLAGGGLLAFVAKDGTTRLLYRPFLANMTFSDVEANVAYFGGNDGTNYQIFKLTYTGDYTDNFDFAFNGDENGGGAPAMPHITTVNLMAGAGNSLDEQIVAKQGSSLASYNFAKYGHWTLGGNINYYGASGHYGFFGNLYSGQAQNGAGGPGWVAVVNLSTNPAQVTALLNTLDGTGLANGRFCGLHFLEAQDAEVNTLNIGCDPLQTNDTSVLHGGPFKAVPTAVLAADGTTWNTNTALPALNALASQYYRTCPVGATNPRGFTECVTLRLPNGGVCNTAATAAEITANPCPWANTTAALYPVMRAGDAATDIAGDINNVDSEHFGVLTVNTSGGHTDVVFARNYVFDYCGFNPYHGVTDSLAQQSPAQTAHTNGWTLSMSPGIGNICGGGGMIYDATSGVAQELTHSISGHSALGLGPNGVTMVTRSFTLYDTPFTSLGNSRPYNIVYTQDPAFNGISAGIVSDTQSYTSVAQFDAGVPGYKWAVDTNANVTGCGWENINCSYRGRPAVTSISGNVYRIAAVGTANQTVLDYKRVGMDGKAGRFQLQDKTGPSSNIDSSAYSMCLVTTAGECHAGSSLNEIYINVPKLYDPGYCAEGQTFASIPCVTMGPADVIRQFRVSQTDSTASYSRIISHSMSSYGRKRDYSHATTYPNGKHFLLMGENYTDGHNWIGYMGTIPPLNDSVTAAADFVIVPVVAPAANFAEVRFGYGRYPGLPSDFHCTNGTSKCVSRSDTSSIPYGFDHEARSLQSCGGGCTINVKAVGPNLMSYQVFTSPDGTTWTASGDIQSLAVGVVTGSACGDALYDTTTGSIAAAGGTGSIMLSVSDPTCVTVNSSNQSWLTLTSGGGGCSLSGGVATCTGAGTIGWSAAVNPISSRTATISPDSATTSFVLTQAGAAIHGFGANQSGRAVGARVTR